MKSCSSTTNFRKGNLVHISGTKVSFSNAQLLTSTGSSTLDFFLGGGLAVGTICAIEEDRYNSYASLLMKYFLAEGVSRNHSLFLASGDKDPKTFLKELPALKGAPVCPNPTSMSSTMSGEGGALCDPLTIAWRYKNKSSENTKKAESYNMGFDLSKTMPAETLEKCSISTWNPAGCKGDEQPATFLKMPYQDLYSKIKSEIESQDLKTSSTRAETVLRIGINSIGSPLWKSGNDEVENLNLVRFLYVLKVLLRKSFAVGVITIPSFLFSNEALMSRVRQNCDTVIELESFVGSDKISNPLFKDFDGLLHIKKLPVLNTFMHPHMAQDLAFKLKKRGLLIEHLHLPPQLEDVMPVQQGCSSLGKKLDF